MQKSNVWLTTTLLNERVRNSAGEDLGKIEDLVLDPVSGNIEYAILSFGGFLGAGDKHFPIPWSALSISPSRNYVVYDVDKESLKRAPAFDRDDWPNMADPTWRRSIHDHYGTAHPVARHVRDVHEDRHTYVERRAPARRGLSVLGGILAVCLIIGLAWVAYLVSTRGWDQAKQDMKTSLQSAAYAAKETTEGAALTTKVKTALSLSKRIPSGKINVDSDKDVVTLRGEVASEEVRTLAETIARDVPGVAEVRNYLYTVGGNQGQ